MNIDRVKEQIKFNTEIIRLIVVVMIATGGGTLSLIIIGPTYARKAVLIAAGMMVVFVCWVITYRYYRLTQALIKKI